MKTGIVEALNTIANGFSASYSNALRNIKGFSGSAQKVDVAKLMFNAPIRQDVVQASANSASISNELGSSSINIVA